MNDSTVKLIREGRFIAEVSVTLIDDEHEWSPRLSVADVRKLDAVRQALRKGDLKAASALARVYELTPVAAE
ncbi:MAG: hypothetical protein ACKVP7_17165 [Hyphomicrobiaceae bacterium]